MPGITYKDAGVDTAEGARAVDAIKAAVQTTYGPEVIGDLGGFGGLFSAAALKGMDDPILVSGTDGVGTKLELAKRLGNHTTVGIDLVAMCVNDIVVSGARPLFFLDYLAVGKLEAAFAAEVVGGIAEGCQQAGCALIGGEMAEHPGTMRVEDYDLSGFCVGVVDRPQMLGPERVREGDAIIGLASSGLHSNGFSLVRRTLTDALSDEELATRPLASSGDERLGDALLTPTRIYVKPLLEALEAGLPIHAAAHITGGGITENLNRALPAGLNACIAPASWEVPAVIQTAVAAAGLDEWEALKTFNMGIGMALICPSEAVAAVTEHFLPLGPVFPIGAVEAASDPTAPSQVLYRAG
ncbi:MAG: phosphoribosylformylglycinamidine cyclo-ligase [Coriobacteriales bacterium]|jgi:phosphoribosylformylglycinamidine cyclo-ligase|nr:phosphoribosylformylglycinamidine cyclo-ligase [Coriobacteriales bacterium]